MQAHDDWKGSTAGTPLMHRMLKGACRLLGLWPIYFFMGVFVAPAYMLVNRRSYMAIWHYLRWRQGFGVLKAFRYAYLNHFRFGQVIIDRFAAYAGVGFKFDLEGFGLFQALMEKPEGFLVLSCHVGNYELVGYSLTAKEKRFNALVYSGEARVVMEERNRILSKRNIRMIPVGDGMSHLFEMNNALSDGEVVSIPADRIFGSTRSVECDFLGAKARFPLGPFAMAVQRELPVLAIFVMKESMHRYRVLIRRLGDGGKQGSGHLAQSFADELGQVLRRYPEQWFNYYEFWNNGEDRH